MSRPLCRYPKRARYDGSGDPASASSFSCVEATRCRCPRPPIFADRAKPFPEQPA
jgi:hypothetical protein